MKRTAFALGLIFALSLSPIGIHLAKGDIVDNYGFRRASGPYIAFPANTTYNSGFLTLNISFSTQLFSKDHFSATYSLDGKLNVTVPLASYPSLIWNKNHVEGFVKLPELSDGSHRISVYVECVVETLDSDGAHYNSYWDSETVCFTVAWTWDEAPVISIHSPLNESCVNNSMLNFTVAKPEWWYNAQSQYWGASAIEQMVSSVSYEIDGKTSIPVNVNSSLSSPINYCMSTSNLKDGVHTLRVHANFTKVLRNSNGVWRAEPADTSSDTVRFTVDTAPPRVSVLSFEANKTSNATSVELVFSINESASWVGYSLDGQENVTITGNTTLTGLTNEEHSLTIYATDSAGNTGTSETITFNQIPFPTSIVVASVVATVVAACAVLLLYLKKRKR